MPPALLELSCDEQSTNTVQLALLAPPPSDHILVERALPDSGARVWRSLERRQRPWPQVRTTIAAVNFVGLIIPFFVLRYI